MQCRSQIVTAEHAVQPENIHRKIQHPCSTEGRATCGRWYTTRRLATLDINCHQGANVYG